MKEITNYANHMSHGIRITSGFFARRVINLGSGILLLAGIAHGGDVKIKRIGERVLLYEHMSAGYLWLAAALPVAERDPAKSKEFAVDMHYQAAMSAFMLYIDRSRVQSPSSRDDGIFRGLIRQTSRLMKKVD